MEKINKIIYCTLFFNTILIYSQQIDSIVINCNYNNYKKQAISNIKDRYLYTQKYYSVIENVVSSIEMDSICILSNYTFEDFDIYSIPKFKIKKNVVVNSKINIIEFIEFEENTAKQNYNIYIRKKLYFDSYFTKIDDRESSLMYNSLIGYGYKNPLMMGGSLKGFLVKLGLEKEYFAFFIEGLPVDNMFIVDKGIVYAIINPTNEGKYEKIEINEYFAKKIGRERLNDIVLNGKITFKKKYKIFGTTYYKKKYFVKVRT